MAHSIARICIGSAVEEVKKRDNSTTIRGCGNDECGLEFHD
jgi:hypothetical protein